MAKENKVLMEVGTLLKVERKVYNSDDTYTAYEVRCPNGVVITFYPAKSDKSLADYLFL